MKTLSERMADRCREKSNECWERRAGAVRKGLPGAVRHWETMTNKYGRLAAYCVSRTRD